MNRSLFGMLGVGMFLITSMGVHKAFAQTVHEVELSSYYQNIPVGSISSDGISYLSELDIYSWTWMRVTEISYVGDPDFTYRAGCPAGPGYPNYNNGNSGQNYGCHIEFAFRPTSPDPKFGMATIKYEVTVGPEVLSVVYIIHLKGNTTSVPKPMLSLSVQMLDANEQLQGSPISSVIKNGNSLSVPLGGSVSLALKDSEGNNQTATFMFSGAPAFDVNAPAIDPVNGLYQDRLALLFSSGVPTLSQHLMPLHLGSQDLTITPMDTSFDPITIKLISRRPEKIGTGVYDCTHTGPNGEIIDPEYANCDDLIIDQAHSKGIPPQYVKAVIWKESLNHQFVKTSFRYEPKYDRIQIEKVMNFRKNINEPKNIALYSKYYLMSESMNQSITAEMRRPRSIYSIRLSDRRIGSVPDNYETSFRYNNYLPLSAWNLVNTDYNYLKNSRGEPDPQGWFKSSEGKLLEIPTYDKYNFVAQTLIASSYGLMQIMYPTAVKTMNYQQNGVGLNPLNLFRPATNVTLGVGYLANQFKKVNGLSQLSQNYHFLSEYEQALMRSSAAYNAGRNYSKPPGIKYSISVLNQSVIYWVNESPFFGN